MQIILRKSAGKDHAQIAAQGGHRSAETPGRKRKSKDQSCFFNALSSVSPRLPKDFGEGFGIG